LDRATAAFSGFTLAAWATLLWDPRAFFSASFQMSYLAVLGLMLALGRWRPPRRWPRPCRAGLQVLLISVVVQLMLLPVSARVFGRVSAAGLVSNVLLVPVSGVLLVAGFAAWGLSFLPWRLPEAGAAAAASGLGGFFRSVCEAFAAWPWSALDVPSMGAGATVLYYAGLVGALLWPARGK
jgi:competence protein ComEC